LPADRPPLCGKRPIVASERDPDSPRKSAAYQNGSRQTACGAAAHPPHWGFNLFSFVWYIIKKYPNSPIIMK